MLRSLNKCNLLQLFSSLSSSSRDLEFAKSETTASRVVLLPPSRSSSRAMEQAASPTEAQERPTKRPRRASPPLASPYRSLPIHAPHTYTPPGAPSTSFQLPLHLTSFSYSPTRQLLLDRPRRDDAMAWYTEPALGVDLNTGYEQCEWREDGEDEGLDSLLDA